MKVPTVFTIHAICYPGIENVWVLNIPQFGLVYKSDNLDLHTPDYLLCQGIMDLESELSQLGVDGGSLPIGNDLSQWIPIKLFYTKPHASLPGSLPNWILDNINRNPRILFPIVVIAEKGLIQGSWRHWLEHQIPLVGIA